VISSAGGLTALLEFFAELPARIPFPVFLSQHLPRNAVSLLPELLRERCALPVMTATDGMRPRAGVVYVVRPGDSLRVTPARMHVMPLDPHWRGWLDAADVFFTSLAKSYGTGAIGVVLSGMMPAGVSGLKAIRRAGGVLMAQSKPSAICFDMPAAACDLAKADIVLPPKGIAQALVAAGERQAWAS
jgi:chemotaxis response regulator CheB